MFEGLVAGLLNKYLGQYIEGLDSENLQLSIYAGKAELRDLTLKPEALHALNLPIEVKSGHVGSITVCLDWRSILSKPLVVTVRDVYALAVPVAERPFDASKEARLERARKRSLLEQLDAAAAASAAKQSDVEEKSPGFTESLAATLINNIQVTVERIHIRYEDTVTAPGHPFACGVMLSSLAAQTTDAQWRPTQVDGQATTVHKLLQLSGLSIYWNPSLGEQSLVHATARHGLHSDSSSDSWRQLMRGAIEEHALLEDNFQFILRPVSARAQVEMNKGSVTVSKPRMLADFFLDDIDLKATRQQFLNVLCLQESFKLLAVNQRYRKWQPGVPRSGHAQQWWKYAANAIIEEKVRPLTWKYIKAHRERYRGYKDTYKEWLRAPTDDTLFAELQRLEDQLDVANITIARGQAKYEFSQETPPPKTKKAEKTGWFSWWFGGDDDEEEEEAIDIPSPAAGGNWLDRLSAEERRRLFEGVGYTEPVTYDNNPEYVAHQVGISVRGCTLSLVNYSEEVLSLSVGQFCVELQHRPQPTAIKLSTWTEAFTLEGVSVEHDMVRLITSQVGVYPDSHRTEVFKAAIELNPHHVTADLALELNVQPIEIVYDEHAVTEMVAWAQVPHLSADEMGRLVYDSLEQLQAWSRAGLQHAINTHKTVHVSANMRSPYVVIPEYGSLHRGGNLIVLDLGTLSVESRPQQTVGALEDLTLSEVEVRLYDRYSVTLSDVKALLADSGEDWHTAQTQADSRFHLLPSVALQLTFFSSLQPEYKQLPRFQIHGRALPHSVQSGGTDKERATKANTLTDSVALNLHLSESQVHTLITFWAHCPGPGRVSRFAPKRRTTRDTRHLADDDDDNDDNLLQSAGRAESVEEEGFDEPDGPAMSRLAGRDDRSDTLGDIGELPLFAMRRSRRDARELPVEPTVPELKNMNRACLRNSIRRASEVKRPPLQARTSVLSTDSSEVYYSASDHSDEDVEEWAQGLGLQLDDPSSSTNRVTALGRFLLGDILLQISRSAGGVDTPYLTLRVNRVLADAAKSQYGLTLHAKLGSLTLVDKIHMGVNGDYLEVLSSSHQTDLISLTYRQVEPECPDFASTYESIASGISVDMSTLELTVHRAAILYLNTFMQGLLHSVQGTLGGEGLRRSFSTILSEPGGGMSDHRPDTHPSQPPAPGFLQRLASQTDANKPTSGVIQMYMYARIEDINIKLCDHEMDFARLDISGVEGRVVVRPSRTVIQARLRDLCVEDLTESTLHPKVLAIDDDNAFDFKMTKYTGRRRHDQDSVDGSAKLRIGRIHVVCLHKFLAEITGFLEPLISPEVTQQYRAAAQHAAVATLADAHEAGTKYSFSIDARSPVLIVPENSASTNVLLLQLGDLAVSNYFEETEVDSGVLQKWDHIYLNLQSVTVIRGKLSLSGSVEPLHTLVQPLHLKLDVLRALPPHRHHVHYHLHGHLHKVHVHLQPTDIRVIMAVLRDNLTETGHMTPVSSPETGGEWVSLGRLAAHESLDTATPVVESEQPLLGGAPTSPDTPSSLVHDASLQLVLDGVQLQLLSEDSDCPDTEGSAGVNAPASAAEQASWQPLALFELSSVRVNGSLGQDGSMKMALNLRVVDMEDVRPHSNLAVKRIIQTSVRPRGSYDESAHVVQVTYIRRPDDHSAHLEVDIETVRLNLCVPYLLELQHFVTDSLATPADKHHVTGGKKLGTSTYRQSRVPSSRTQNSLRTPASAAQPQTQDSESYTVTAQFKQPEVVLFADPTSVHSRVLVLKASGKLNYYFVNGKEDMDARLREVKVISGVWGDAQRTASLVLHPCVLECTRHRESPTAPISMTLKASDMYLNVCNTTLYILMSVYDVIKEEQSKTPSTADVTTPSSRRYYDLWQTKTISKDEWLEPEQEPDKIQFPDDAAVARETLTLDMPRVQLTFEVENLDYNVPRLCLKTALTATAHDWSSQARMSADVSLEVLYFNDRLAVWEPLVEPVKEREDCYRPWQLTCKMARAESQPLSVTPPSSGSRGRVAVNGSGGGEANAALDSAVSAWLHSSSAERRRRHLANASSSEASADDMDGGSCTPTSPQAREGGAGEMQTTVIRPPDLLRSAGRRSVRSTGSGFDEYPLLSEESDDSSSSLDQQSSDYPASGSVLPPRRSVAGDSDSEIELAETLSSGLEGMRTSSPSSSDASDEDDDLFDSPLKPVFLTARGPVTINSAPGLDNVDGPMTSPQAELVTADDTEAPHMSSPPQCTYLLLEARDQLLVNVTPPALSVLTEVMQAVSKKENSVLKSIQDLPAFEIFNNLGVDAEISFENEDQVYRPRMHRARLSARCESQLVEHEEPVLVEIVNDDELDGCHHILKSLASRQWSRQYSHQTSRQSSHGSGRQSYRHSGRQLSRGTSRQESYVTAAGPACPESPVPDLQAPDPKLPHLSHSEMLDIGLEGFSKLDGLSHQRQVSQLLPLRQVPETRDSTAYAFVYDVTIKHGRKIVTMRSPLQLVNHLSVPVELYVLKSELREQNITDKMATSPYTRIDTVAPGAHYHVPLYVAYHCKLHLRPLTQQLERSEEGVWWQDLVSAKERRKLFSCKTAAEDVSLSQYYFKVICEDGQATRRTLNVVPVSKMTPHYTLHVHPPLVVHNLLPYTLAVTPQDAEAIVLEKGEQMPLHCVGEGHNVQLRLELDGYLGDDWTGQCHVSEVLDDEFRAVAMEAEQSGEGKQLSLSVRARQGASLDLYVFAPYWLINKTGLPVQIRGSRSDAVYESASGSEEPLLFRYRKYKRRRAKLRVHNSARWTRSFSLDTVANSGVVICHDRERRRNYHFLLQIEMSKLQLTKIVTILPYFLVVNKTDQPLRFMEENPQADLWQDLEPDQCSALWPVGESYRMCVQWADSTLRSQHFSFNTPASVVLRMDRGSAVGVEVAGGTDTAFTVTLRPYELGDAPVRVDNLCSDVFIKLFQKNHSEASLLSPCQSVLYTWDDPTLERTLMWNSVHRKGTSQPAQIAKDGWGSVSLSIQSVRRQPNGPSSSGSAGNGEDGDSNGLLATLLRRSRSREIRAARPPESSTDDDSDAETSGQQKGTRTDKVQVYWVSYQDGPQRVLQFSQDERIAKKAIKKSEAEPAQLELFMSLAGLGLSLINARCEEVAFVTLTPSPAMWQVESRRKTKLLNAELASLLEECWRQGRPTVQLHDFLEADLDKMEMKRPFLGSLRRIYNPALWAHYRHSEHHTYLHTRVHRLQIDNQLCDAYFPTVLYPSSAPGFVVRRTGPKPFLDFMVLRKTLPENDIDTVRFASALVQEFNIKLDKGFLMSVYDIFAENSAMEESEHVKADVATTKKTLYDIAHIQAATRPQKVFFEYVHLSPLKLHVSFSLAGTVHSTATPDDQSFVADALDFFLTSIGTTLTEVKDVELRLAFFEREGVLLTWNQLAGEARSHYTSQLIKQAYVLLFGLDVLGNPYGLIRDFTHGLGDLFYEPVMGSLEQPDQFADRLSYGVRSMLGHTVGSMAGSVSLVTGSVGRTLALLSFDDNYQQKRRQHFQQQPTHLPASIYLAGKSFVMGVALGLSGVVTQPVRGVQEEGAEGFFKGVGKGLLGLLTKPAVGALDMVSMAFDGVRRTAEMGEDVVVRIRLPRHIHPMLGVRPFSMYQAVGVRILQSVGKGRFRSSGDIYWAHAPLSADDRADVLLVTDRRVILLEKCRFWGDWDLDWQAQLLQLEAPPVVNGDKLVLTLKQEDDSDDTLLGRGSRREAQSADAALLEWLAAKIQQAADFTAQM